MIWFSKVFWKQIPMVKTRALGIGTIEDDSNFCRESWCHFYLSKWRFCSGNLRQFPARLSVFKSISHTNFILYSICLEQSGFNGTVFLSCRSNFQIHEAKQYETIKITSSLNVSNRNIMEAIFFRFIHLQFDSFVVCDKFIIFFFFLRNTKTTWI